MLLANDSNYVNGLERNTDDDIELVIHLLKNGNAQDGNAVKYI